MLITFGTKSYKISSYQPSQLGITDMQNSDVESIELHQEYFHVNGLGCYGIKKKWLIKKTDGSYQLLSKEYTDDLTPFVKQVKFQRKAYFWPLFLGIGLFICWSIFFTVSFFKSKREQEQKDFRFELQQKNLITKFRNPKLYDCYLIQPFETQNFDSFILQIDSINSNAVHLVSYDSLNLKKEYYSTIDLDLYKQLLDFSKKKPTNSFWIEKSKLEKCIYKGEKDGETTFRGIPLREITPDGKYAIQEIYRITETDLEIMFFSTVSIEGNFTIGIENKGASCNIIDIKSDNSLKWKIEDYSGKSTKFPYKLSCGESVNIGATQGNQNKQLNFMITCKDTFDNVLSFGIKGTIEKPILFQQMKK